MVELEPGDDTLSIRPRAVATATCRRLYVAALFVLRVPCLPTSPCLQLICPRWLGVGTSGRGALVP